MATQSGGLSWKWSWETRGEKNECSVHFDVGTLLLFDFVTPFGTIREQRNNKSTDEEGGRRPLSYHLRSLNLHFDLHRDCSHGSHVGNVVGEALSRLRLDSHPLADELRLLVTHLVLAALSCYMEHYYDPHALGCAFRIRVEEEKVTTVELLECAARAFFEAYIQVGTSDHGMLDGPCAICLGDISAGDEIGRTTECGHCFHFGCIARWLCRRMSCPMCRTAVRRLRF